MISFCVVFCNLASLTGIWPSSVGDQLFILSCQIWEDSQLLFKILILPALYTWAFYENMYYVFSMYSCKRTKDISKFSYYLFIICVLHGNVSLRKMFCPTWTYCLVHGTLFNVTWQSGWEGSLGKNEYIYMYGWVTLLFIWNYHNFAC